MTPEKEGGRLSFFFVFSTAVVDPSAPVLFSLVAVFLGLDAGAPPFLGLDAGVPAALFLGFDAVEPVAPFLGFDAVAPAMPFFAFDAGGGTTMSEAWS